MKVFLYSKPNLLSIGKIEEYLKKNFKNLNIELFEDFFGKYLKKDRLEELSEELASIRVLKPDREFEHNEATYGEIQYETRVLSGEISPHGILYDGFKLQNICRRLLPRGQRNLDCIHIIFTDRFVGTFDEEDLKYHSRVIILGFPHLISTTGLVEAPAKPREFYIQKRFLEGDQLAYEKLKEYYKGRFIDYGDPRMEEVLKGYAMQAIFYQIFDEAFCNNKRCRLYNSHWQEEVMEAQLTEPEFCDRHSMMAKSL